MKADLPLAKTSSSKLSLVSSVVAIAVAPMRKSAILLPRVLKRLSQDTLAGRLVWFHPLMPKASVESYSYSYSLFAHSSSLFASYSRIRLVGESGVSGLGKDGRNPIGKDLHDFDQSYCARGEHAGEPPRPFSVHAGTRSAWLKLCERFWQERPNGGSDEGRLSTSSTPSSGSISRELSPTVQSPASDAPLCPLASALPAGVLLIPADTSPSVRPKNPIALMGQPTLAVPTSSHSGTHASSL